MLPHNGQHRSSIAPRCWSTRTLTPLILVRILVAQPLHLPDIPTYFRFPGPARKSGAGRAERLHLHPKIKSHCQVRGPSGHPTPAVDARARLIPSARLALRSADLCKQSQHVEVVRDALDLSAFDLDELAGRYLDRCSTPDWRRLASLAVRCGRPSTGARRRRCLRSRSRARSGLGVGDGLGPALPRLDDLAGALDATVGSLLIVYGVRGQRVVRLAPVLVVVCGYWALAISMTFAMAILLYYRLKRKVELA